MGMLTTMMVYHDELDLLNESKQVTDALYENLYRGGGGGGDVMISGKSSTATLFKVKKTRHSSFTALYMQHGNTLFEVSPYSDEMVRLKQTNPDLFDELVEILENYVKDLKRL